MAHPYQDQIQHVIDLLRMVKDEVYSELNGIPDIRAGILAPLVMLDNRLSHLIGKSPAGEEAPSRTFGPIRLNKSAMPKDSETIQEVTEQLEIDVEKLKLAQTTQPFSNLPMTAAQSADQAQKNYAEHLKTEREKIYDGFADRDPNELLDSVEDPLVRAVAKKAGIKVSENIPERITRDFIIKIQTKMKADRDLAARVAAGQQSVEDLD